MRGNTIALEGVGTVNGHGSHPFVLKGEDNGDAARDRLILVTVDGAPWPNGGLRSGAGVVPHLP
jgi:hypothetical protein